MNSAQAAGKLGVTGNKLEATGKVWIVGAGPGDPELLTMRAVKVLNSADLIFFDYLVSDQIRALFPKSVPAFCVGKRKGDHSIHQSDLNALLIKKARAGKRICRLKGGDPFVFGRGGEELLALLNAGVEAEVVPGVTSASGCSTYAGIPLTHRGLSQGCTFVTGHGEQDLTIHWSSLATLNHTLVFYMGLTRAEMIRSQLLINGMAASTPVALIENGCRADQRVIVGALDDLVAMINDNDVQSPSLIVVGEVVSLATQFNPQVIASQFAPQKLHFDQANYQQDRLSA